MRNLSAGVKANRRIEDFLLASPFSLEASPPNRGTFERNTSSKGFVLVLKAGLILTS